MALPALIKLSESNGPHKGGTKEYSVILIEGPDGAAMITRWGKVGTPGQFKFETVSKNVGALRKYIAKIDERRASGYDMVERMSRAEGHFDFINSVINSKMARDIAEAHWRSVWHGYNASSGLITGAKPDLTQARNEMIAQMERQARENAEDKRRREEAEEAELLKSNPLFGMF